MIYIIFCPIAFKITHLWMFINSAFNKKEKEKEKSGTLEKKKKKLFE